MKTKFFFSALIFLVFQFQFGLNPVNAQDHVVLNTFNVNIRTGPGTDHFVVCMAGKGEIFKLVSEKGDWLEIEMFSGNNRFVHRSLVYFLTEFVPGHRMTLPQSEDKIKTIYFDIQLAKSLSLKDAGEIIPASISKDRHDNFQKICQDKHIHVIFEIHCMQTAMFSEVMDFVKKKKW